VLRIQGAQQYCRYMPRARKHLVCLSDTHYYHVFSRCVRRAFLCGTDSLTGISYEHRRGWIEDRVRVLSSVFSISLCAYAIMSNHYHLVVKLNPKEPAQWSDDEVLVRWCALFRGPILIQRYLNGERLCPSELESVRSVAAVFRSRLGSLSWFMKCLNEPIARKANAEDGCSGHFWEARFQSQPLCTNRALLTAMAYVDLNPIRAKMARTPEQSEHTSVKARLVGNYGTSTLSEAVPRMLRRNELHHSRVRIRPLMKFASAKSTKNNDRLPILEREYLKLVDTTGRIIVRGNCGRIDPSINPILERLGLSGEEWMSASTGFRQRYRHGDLRKTA